MQSLITALDGAVVSLQQGARREFTQYLGEDVGGAAADVFEFQTNVGEGIVKAGLQTVVSIQQLDPMRFASDPDGAKAAWDGVLDTLKYANPAGVIADPTGAFQHGKEMLGGIAHAEDWRTDRPGLGLGGVLFEAGSAATGVGAAKTGLRGVSAAAESGEAGAAVRAVAGGADTVAPIAGRASEIAGKLDDLTTLADGLPSGATAGTHGPALPPSLAEPHLPRVPEAPRIPETPTPHGVPETLGPQHASDGPAPRPAELAQQHVPDADLPVHGRSDADASRAPEPAVSNSGTATPEGSRPPTLPTASEVVPSTREPAMVGSGSGATHTSEMPPAGSSGASHGSTEAPRLDPATSDSNASQVGSDASHESSPHGSGEGPGHESDSGALPDGNHGPHDGHTPDEPVQHGGEPSDSTGVGHGGETVRTGDLQHPSADLLDESELDAARDTPTRLTDALVEGLPSPDPIVRAIVPEDFDKYGGLSRSEWEDQYWPSRETDTHGSPKLTWPDPDRHPEGFLSPQDRHPAVLEPGSNFDRFGPGFGRFVSPEGTPFPERGLPFQSLDDGYHRYEVVKELPVWEGPIAPAMGQPGGGIQYYLPYSVVDLLIAGYIREVT